MDKPIAAVSCPLDTYSGYGARARDFVKALIALDKYDVQIISQRWGNTRFGYLEDHQETDLINRIVPNLTSQPDLWIQITVPNEFQKIGKYNIGVTAGMETTLVHQSWLDGCNRMDLVLTSSNHSKAVFEGSKFEERNRETNQVQRKIELTTKVEVLLEGADLTKYFPKKSSFDLGDVSEQFCYLFVGHWLKGDFGHDRKNVGVLIKSFLETFKNKPKQPALLLKTSTVGTSILDRTALLKKINQIRSQVKGKLPKIYVIHGEFSDEEMNNLYNDPRVKVMVSFTKGEGFGRPLLEFSLTGKPVIASGWSGQKDFLSPKLSLLVGGELENVHASAEVKDMILTQAKWYKPDPTEINQAFTSTFKHYKRFLPGAKKQRAVNKANFSFKKMMEVLKELDEKYVPEFPKKLELQLPKLDLPKLQ